MREKGTEKHIESVCVKPKGMLLLLLLLLLHQDLFCVAWELKGFFFFFFFFAALLLSLKPSSSFCVYLNYKERETSMCFVCCMYSVSID